MKKHQQLFLLVTLLLLISAGYSYAHALYIDTDAHGKRGISQEVRIYYSEFKDRKVEKVADWYSDVADFQLWLVNPDGERTQLKTTGKNDHYSATFTPEENGPYRLEIGHTAEDPGDKTAYQFNAFAQVWVGNALEMLPVNANSPELILIESKAPGKVGIKTFRTYFKGQPREGVSATLFLPSGKTKTLESNSEGLIEIRAEEEGIYFLEATTYHENEAGKTRKAAFESIWRCATQKFEIL